MEELYLNVEERKIIEKHQKLIQESKQKDILFWKNEYSQYSWNERKSYWLSNIYHGMRQQADVMKDMYSEFSYEWYIDVKNKEPKFDSIFLEIINKFDFEFNWQEYQKRISVFS